MKSTLGGPYDVAEYQMPLLREIEIRLKKKCDKLADAFIDSDLGEGTTVNASPCSMDFYHMCSYAFITEVVARSATWLGRVLSCVCAQSIEDDSHTSFDLTPAQTEAFFGVSLYPYLMSIYNEYYNDVIKLFLQVFLEYDDADSSTRARQRLNGRKFDGNQVVASF
nr:ELMO domain-containing protein A-like isoform X2 [Tanacetum cinerariifolium]